MARHGLLTLEPGTDARQRIARLTDRARALLPLIEAEWAATSAAAAGRRCSRSPVKASGIPGEARALARPPAA